MSSINDFTDLEFLKKYCQQNLKKIAAKSINNNLITSIKVRYVNLSGFFGYTTIGNLFFISDSMHLITDDPIYRSEHDDEVFDMFEELEPLRNKNIYIVRVIFAGFSTGFVDDKGKEIFTGDMVETRIIVNPTSPSAGGRQRAMHEGINARRINSITSITAGVCVVNNEPSVILDNHYAPLKWAVKLKVIGNVFYELSQHMEEVDIFSRCAALAQMRSTERDDVIFLSTFAPYFGELDWKRAALRQLGVEDELS